MIGYDHLYVEKFTLVTSLFKVVTDNNTDK